MDFRPTFRPATPRCSGIASGRIAGVHRRLLRVETKWASRFIKDSLEQRIFVPAESDLHFELPDGQLRLLFCHDDDVHVSGSDDELRERLFASAALRTLTFTKYRKEIQ
jgi:hypothetical protein